MKRIIRNRSRWLVIGALILAPGSLCAQDPISIIAGGITKVIKAVDLQIQRMQTKTIWLEEAQKVVENALSQLGLEEIRGWVQAQKDLYSDYFQELWRVKSFIAYYERISVIIRRQEQIFGSYRQARAYFRQSGLFTAAELSSMEGVYGGIINESMENLNQLLLVINSFSTQMTDEQRMAIIDRAGDHMDTNFRNLVRFNNHNAAIALQRGAEAGELALLKNLYGL